MTEYAYKLVSLKARGQIDWPALKRATERGWEPTPIGEEPVPSPNPLNMTPEQLENFRLCRMPKEKHTEIIEGLAALNRGLAGRWTPSLMLTFRTSGRWPEIGTVMQRRIVDDDTGEELIPEILLDEDMLTGAKLAYEWLTARGIY